MLLIIYAVAFFVGASAGPPGDYFDLSIWNLQLPVSNGAGGIQTIRPPALSTYSSEYFYTNTSDNGMTFWAPINGATTSGSNYPRSELREITNWTFRGNNLMTVTIYVLEQPTNGKVVIGQIHVDGVSGSCSIIEELQWFDGIIYAYHRDQNCGTVRQALGTYSIGERINYSLALVGTLMTVTTDKGRLTYNYAWFDTSVQIYFKAGSYVQDSGSSSTIGGRTKITALSVSHS